MANSNAAAIASTLLAAVDLRRRLALGMFRVDNPDASDIDFDKAANERYFAYADSVIGDLVEQPLVA